MDRPESQQGSRGRRKRPQQGLRALIWRGRWFLLLAMLIFAPPANLLLHLYLARFGLGWMPLLVLCPLLVVLLVIGTRREMRRSRPGPPRPPGLPVDTSSQATADAALAPPARLAA
jgi:hypothetical protein